MVSVHRERKWSIILTQHLFLRKKVENFEHILRSMIHQHSKAQQNGIERGPFDIPTDL
jgi:hypothetical protein